MWRCAISQLHVSVEVPNRLCEFLTPVEIGDCPGLHLAESHEGSNFGLSWLDARAVNQSEIPIRAVTLDLGLSAIRLKSRAGNRCCAWWFVQGADNPASNGGK
jgi:hypothetical protein